MRQSTINSLSDSRSALSDQREGSGEFLSEPEKKQTTSQNMKIEKGIQMPKNHSIRNRKHHDLYELVKDMKVGDSFLVDKKLIFGGTFSSRAYLEKKFGIKLTQCTTAEGMRVWRTA